MSNQPGSFSASYFEDKYRTDIDPWKFRSSTYEREKYDRTLAALSRPTYERGLEVGCSIGVFTQRLATRCGLLTAIDGSKIAIQAAAENAPANVRLLIGMLPQDFPVGTYDLILLSEILYFLSEEDLERVAQQCCHALAPGGEIIACHWLGLTNYPLSGATASAIFGAAVTARVPVRTIFQDDVYRLERFSEP